MPLESVSIDSTPNQPTGIDRMMAQLDAAHSSGKPVETAPATPEAPAAPAADPKPATPSPAPKPATPAPAAVAAKPQAKSDAQPAQPEPDWTKAPPKWHKIYEDHKTKTGETIKSLEAKLKSLEAKPFESPGDTKKIEAYEKQLAEMRGELEGTNKKLAQRDYTQTEEYKRNFAEPAKRIYKEAVGFVSRLRVQDGDQVRQATQDDFDDLRSLQGKARKTYAKELFGEDNYDDVLDYIKNIDSIQLRATIAAEQHAESYQAKALENEGRTKQERQQYEDFHKEALEGIQSNETWGKWFREDEADPEASKLLREGFEEIEKVTAQMDKLPLDQRAGWAALYAARAAAAPRFMLEINRITAERDALREELEKIRGTDPGAAGHGGITPAANGGQKRMGIEGAAAVFDQAPR